MAALEAVQSGDLDMLQRYLGREEPSARVEDSCAPLPFRCELQADMANTETEVAGLSRVDAHDEWLGGTALQHAAAAGQLACASWLLDAGANVNHRDSIGWTPLMAACSAGHVPLAARLIRAGAAVDMQDACKLSPLMHGAVHPRSGLVQLLLKAGAARDARGPHRITAQALAERKVHALRISARDMTIFSLTHALLASCARRAIRARRAF